MSAGCQRNRPRISVLGHGRSASAALAASIRQRGSSPVVQLSINVITSIVGLLPARWRSGVVAADRAWSAGVRGRVVIDTIASIRAHANSSRPLAVKHALKPIVAMPMPLA
jgi:hypothetical protein